MAASGQGEDSGDSFAILSSFAAQPKVAKCALKACGGLSTPLEELKQHLVKVAKAISDDTLCIVGYV